MRKLTHWLDEYTPSESLDILRDAALSHAAEGGNLGERIAVLIKRGDFRSLCDFEFQPAEMEVNHLRHCRQAVAFFSKLEELDIGVDREAVTWLKFLKAEDGCGVTNAQLRSWARGEFNFLPGVERAVMRAKRKIAQVLGEVPKLSELGLRFGKGATTSTPRSRASVVEKLGVTPSCSEDLFPIAKAVLREMPHYSAAVADSTAIEYWLSERAITDDAEVELSSLFAVMDSSFRDQSGKFDEVHRSNVPVEVVDGNVCFVPKNASVYRTTITEPLLNGVCQVAIGDYMSRRLAAFGVDIRDQTRNQNLAREGSLTGALATLDLSDASDTIALETVYHLLPLEWAAFLRLFRTSHVVHNGQRKTLEKFSSMGNGFTFPLETLIFWALSRGVCDDDETVSVYGDDIIVPSRRYHEVVETLNAFGFIVNKKKSFHTGPFRESCGCDFLSGIDVRPFYQKEWLSPRTLFLLHNFYKRRGDDARAEWVLQKIHPDLRIYGPDGYGDGHLLGDFPRIRKPRHDAVGLSGFFFSTYALKARKDLRPNRPGDSALPLYSIYRRSAEDLLDLETLFAESLVKATHGEDELVDQVAVRKVGFMRRLKFSPGSLDRSDPIPVHAVRREDEEGKFAGVYSVKGVDFPSADTEYKKISIYVLG